MNLRLSKNNQPKWSSWWEWVEMEVEKNNNKRMNQRKFLLCSVHQNNKTISHQSNTCQISKVITNKLGIDCIRRKSYFSLKNMGYFTTISKQEMTVFLIIFNSSNGMNKVLLRDWENFWPIEWVRSWSRISISMNLIWLRNLKILLTSNVCIRTLNSNPTSINSLMA